mmetsp:Transcript_22253/g.34560  ORF Transcript_22253/g.34560 Transcript_22253/m.34560 type:complete len:228 (-) Transcript_22253:2-685(-)
MYLSVFCTKPSLGKVDKASLPQQTLMELLIAQFENMDIIGITKENPKDISEWHGITLNDSGEVTEINWTWGDFGGSIDLQWMPSTLRTADISSDVFSDFRLEGTIDLIRLPPVLKSLKLSENRFTGEISLICLPEPMTTLELTFNRLSGPLDLTKLPKHMKRLHLDSNCFTGVTDFSQLPESLTDLRLSGNYELSGEIHERKGAVWMVAATKVKVIGIANKMSENGV